MAVVFAADDGVHGQELWITNGTAAGTRLLKDINPSGGGVTGWWTGLIGGKTVFTATDGSTAGIWTTDGTEVGTVLLAALHTSDATAQSFAQVGDTLFVSVSGANGRELWTTDGTEAGTEFLTELNWRPLYAPGGIASVGNKFVFANSDAVHGVELWVTDGTQAGTHLLADILDDSEQSEPYGSWPREFTAFGDKVVFSTDGQGAFITDGNVEGTQPLVTDPWLFRAHFFTPLADDLIFAGRGSASTQHSLWKTDGTPGGTEVVKSFLPDDPVYNRWSVSIDKLQAQPLGSSVFFSVTEYNYDTNAYGSDTGLWLSDGTVHGTVQLTDFAASTWSSVFLGNDLLFGNESLWISDGTTAGTHQISTVEPVLYDTTSARLGDKLYFSGTDASTGAELWVTDGTAAGTHLVKDMNPTGDSGPGGFIQSGNSLYFAADDGVNGYQLWVTDGSTEGTRLLQVGNGSGTVNPFGLSIINIAPDDITLAGGPIAENAAAGAVVGTLSASDFDLTDTHTFTLLDDAGGRFAIEGDKLLVASGALLDFERSPTHTITVRATDQGGKFIDKTQTIGVEDMSELIGTSGDDTFELYFGGAGSVDGGDGHDTVLATASVALGTLSFTNVEELQVGFTGMQLLASFSQLRAFTQITPSPGISSIAIWLKGSTDDTVLDFSESVTAGVSVAVNASDTSGSVVIKTGSGDDALTGGSSNDLFEGGTGSDTLDGGDGFDIAMFDGEFRSYRLERVDELSFETHWLLTSPLRDIDVLRNIEWIAFKTIGDLLVSDLIGVLSDVDAAESAVAENVARGSLVGLTYQAADGNGEKVSYSLIDNAGGAFTIDASTGVVSVAGPLDYETAPSVQIIVQATSADGSLTRKTVHVEVADVNEGPQDITLSSSSVAEHSATGAIVATIAAADPDWTDWHSYTLRNNAGGRFSLDGDKLVVADGTLLDFEQKASHTVTVRAKDQGGRFVDKTLTITLNDVAAETITGDARANTFSGGAGKDTIAGAGGNDRIAGMGGDDRLFGGADADTLIGGDGDDRLDGGDGADSLAGGNGSDYYWINSGDVIVEAVGSGLADRVHASEASLHLGTLGGGFIEQAVLTGALNLNVTGNAAANALWGNHGANTLNGKLGLDYLVGGAGKDKFVFDTKLGAQNVDHIVDFARGDRIALENAIFAKLGAAGGLKAAYFEVGKADDKDDFIHYDKATGALFYDADGNGAGAGIKFAVIGTKLALTAADFLVI